MITSLPTLLVQAGSGRAVRQQGTRRRKSQPAVTAGTRRRRSASEGAAEVTSKGASQGARPELAQSLDPRRVTLALRFRNKVRQRNSEVLKTTVEKNHSLVAGLGEAK